MWVKSSSAQADPKPADTSWGALVLPAFLRFNQSRQVTKWILEDVSDIF